MERKSNGRTFSDGLLVDLVGQRTAKLLAQLDAVVPWESLAGLIRPLYGNTSAKGGRPNVPVVMMLKITFTPRLIADPRAACYPPQIFNHKSQISNRRSAKRNLIPPPNPRYHTSMPDPLPRHPAGLTDDALLKQCTTRRSRASGPGGQHRNKVETAIELTHTPTGITASASERRSQADNHRTALKRLRLKLATHHRTKKDPQQPPSPLWLSRVKSRRLVISSDHADFPPILAEALDTLAALNCDTTKAAAVLGVTGSQLVKLCQKEPAVLAQVNAERTQRGLRILRGP